MQKVMFIKASAMAVRIVMCVKTQFNQNGSTIHQTQTLFDRLVFVSIFVGHFVGSLLFINFFVIFM